MLIACESLVQLVDVLAAHNGGVPPFPPRVAVFHPGDPLPFGIREQDAVERRAGPGSTALSWRQHRPFASPRPSWLG